MLTSDAPIHSDWLFRFNDETSEIEQTRSRHRNEAIILRGSGNRPEYLIYDTPSLRGEACQEVIKTLSSDLTIQLGQQVAEINCPTEFASIVYDAIKRIGALFAFGYPNINKTSEEIADSARSHKYDTDRISSFYRGQGTHDMFAQLDTQLGLDALIDESDSTHGTASKALGAGMAMAWMCVITRKTGGMGSTAAADKQIARALALYCGELLDQVVAYVKDAPATEREKRKGALFKIIEKSALGKSCIARLDKKQGTKTTWEILFEEDGTFAALKPPIIANHQGGSINGRSGVTPLSLSSTPNTHTAASDSVEEDKKRISELSKQNKKDEAREILKPFVDRGDMQGIVDRLDVSSPRDGGFLWSGNKKEALKVATARGGVIMESTLGGHIVDGWDYLDKKFGWKDGNPDGSGSSGAKFWGLISAKYSNGLNGKTVALMTPTKKEKGGGITYKNVERPIINRRRKTREITGHTIEEIPESE